ncbi:MAG: NADPH-dependent FMN reductase [Opitutae bacterium]
MKITLVSGTNRPGSNTRRITGELAALYIALGQPVEILDLAELPAELFLPAAYETKPPAFARFNDAILASDGVHIVTPEYNGGAPGVLKYFIDMLSHPEAVEGRAFAFTGLSAGVWGALRPIEQLAAMLSYRNAHLFPTRVFLPGVGKLLAADGKLASEDAQKRLRAQAAGFVAFVGQLKK